MSQMTHNKLEEILLDVEINLNNHPLMHVEDGFQFKGINTEQHDTCRTINSKTEDDSDEWTVQKIEI